MAKIARGNKDNIVLELKKALDQYENDNPGAEAALYRQNSASVRIRVIDRYFEGMTKSRRHEHVWKYLANRVKEDSLRDISMLLAIAPTEQRDSFGNYDFDNPTISNL